MGRCEEALSVNAYGIATSPEGRGKRAPMQVQGV